MEKAHILLGISVSVENIDSVIKIIKKSENIEVAKKSNFVKSIVSITSDKCYENIVHYKKIYSETDRLGGLDPYSASKASAELIIKSYRDSFFKKKIKCGISSARAGNVIGGGDWSQKRLIPDCIRFIRNNSKIKIISFVGRIAKDNYVYDTLEVCKKLGKNRQDFLLLDFQQ